MEGKGHFSFPTILEQQETYLKTVLQRKEEGEEREKKEVFPHLLYFQKVRSKPL